MTTAVLVHDAARIEERDGGKVFGAVEAAVRRAERVEVVGHGVGFVEEETRQDAGGVDGAVGVPQVVAARDHDFHCGDVLKRTTNFRNSTSRT